MFRNYILLALRNLLKHKRYALINIMGLSVGLASFILIILWVQDELSYDNFHKDAENIDVVFRVDNGQLFGATSKLLAPTIKNEIPEIKESTCFMPLPESFKSLFRYEEQAFTENFALADKNFFNIFSFPLLEGDKLNVLNNPNSIVLTKRMKEKYFGKEEALGKSLSITFFGQTKFLKVTGILQNLPHNSHIQSEILIPVDFISSFGINWDAWYNQAPTTYIKTNGKVTLAELEQKILAVKQNHFKEEKISYSLMPIKKIHLNATGINFFSAGTGDIKYVFIFSAIAAIILLIASMNYMNLSNALSLKRAKEVGVKKTLGSSKFQLVKQYFSETFIMVLISMAFAVLIAFLCLPVMNDLSGKVLEIQVFSFNFFRMLVAVLLLTTLVSGIYPAVFITGFNPLSILKGKFVTGTKSFNIRKSLVVFQFSLSVIIIVSTVVISRQLNFIQHVNLGYNKENLVCITPGGEISENYEVFKNEVRKSGFVSEISRSGNLDASTMSKTDDIKWPGKQDKFSSWILHVDDEFASTYNIKMSEGRFYSKEYRTEMENGFVINKKAAIEMGYENAIGKDLEIWGQKGKIIGVTEDFHFSSLHNKIEPLIMLIPKPEEANARFNAVTFRLSPNSLPESIEYLEKTWSTFFPDNVFDYYFMEDQLNANYYSEHRMGTLFRYFSALAIFIACLGLYGLTAFTIEQKKKEIGVYKVFGANASLIFVKFTKTYMYWVIIANVFAFPVSYLLMLKWLGNFVYKTGISAWPFIISVCVTLLVSIITIGWQTIRAALCNPVEALRYE